MKTNAVTPEGKVVKAQPSSKPEIGEFANVRVKPVEYKCSTVDWIRYGSSIAGFSTLGCMTGAALPLLAAFVHGSLTPLGIACLTSVGTLPGFCGIIGSSVYISNTPTK